MAAAADSLLWSRLLAGRLAWQMGGGTVRVLRVRWNQHARQADRTRPHRHPFHQILYYSRGRGTQQLGEQRRPVAPGSICFIAAGVAHSFLGTGPRPATCLALDFELEDAEHKHHDDDAAMLKNALRAGERQVFPLSLRFQRQVAACMSRINRETEARQTGYATAVQGMLLELLALFLRATRRTPAFARSHAPPPWRNEGVVRRAVALAGQVPDEVEGPAPTLGAAAAAVKVSPNHLNRLLRQQTGLTFRQLLIQRRVELAKTLLRNGDESCTDVALTCGFGDSNYFARLFRKKTGLTPTEFRRRAR
ncbi:MAG TPA: AraC family transcriptional regulator [Polyangia bacterium]|nr:AraC family transcriptional regulator [Polyangia bacterium]